MGSLGRLGPCLRLADSEGCGWGDLRLAAAGLSTPGCRLGARVRALVRADQPKPLSDSDYPACYIGVKSFTEVANDFFFV
jgi:hypothetical protein